MPMSSKPARALLPPLLAFACAFACAGDDDDETAGDASASATTSATATTATSTTTGTATATETETDAGTMSASGTTDGTATASTTDGTATTSTTTSTTDGTTTEGTTSTTEGTTTTGTTDVTTTGVVDTSDTDTTTTTTTTGDSDSDTDPDTDSGGNQCTQCNVSLASTQSSSFVALPGTEFMGYATLQDSYIIYALDEVGPGRVIYTGDTNLLYKEQTDCPLWEWLGDSGMQLPKVLSFGRYLCGGLGNNLGNYPDLTYAGDHLPAQYVGNPAQLAADYQAVIYCTLAATTQAEAQTIVDYVKVHGGGLYLASEYFGFLSQADVDRINTIGMPLGVKFETTNLNWGQAMGQIDFACFPMPQ